MLPRSQFTRSLNHLRMVFTAVWTTFTSANRCGSACVHLSRRQDGTGSGAGDVAATEFRGQIGVLSYLSAGHCPESPDATDGISMA
jgi:hypothetical protein